LWRFCLGSAVGATAYACGVAVLIALYSKVLENLDQGVMMGWLSSSGSVSRIIGPLAASYTIEFAGPSVVFIEIISVMALTLLTIIIGYKKLLPRVKEKPTIPARNSSEPIPEIQPLVDNSINTVV